MKRVKNINILITVFIVMLFILMGSSGSVMAQEEITLEFPSWQATEPGTSDWWKALNKEFEEQHPNVKINFDHVTYSQYMQKMITRFVAGNPPDIVHLPTANLATFTSRDWLEPLDEFLKETVVPDKWVEMQYAPPVTRDNKTYTVLVLGYGLVMGYNEQMLEDAGVEKIPTNSEELIEASKKITKDLDGDGTIDQYGFGMPIKSDTYINITQFLVEEGTMWTDESGNLNITNESIIKALKKARQFKDILPSGLSDQRKREMWQSGRIAMMMDGPWISGFIQEANEDVKPHLKLAPVPFEGPPIGGVSNSLSLPKDISDKKKELVKEYIKLFTSEEWQRKYATIAGQPPARSGVVNDKVLEEKPNMDLFANAAENAVSSIPKGLVEHNNEFRDLVDNMVLRLFTTDTPVEELLKDLESKTEDMLSK